MLISGPTVTGRRTCRTQQRRSDRSTSARDRRCPERTRYIDHRRVTITLAARACPARVTGLGSNRAFAALPNDTYLTIPVS
jgi:hypothetical protein